MSVAADAHSTVATHIFPTCTNSDYTPIVGPMLFVPVLMTAILLMTIPKIRNILLVPKEVPESVAYDGPKPQSARTLHSSYLPHPWPFLGDSEAR